jgi:hypothetical protein
MSPSKKLTELEAHYKNWLTYILDISFGRDGYTTAKSLGELVDELNTFAGEALGGKPCPLKQYKADKKMEEHRRLLDMLDLE